MIMYIIFLFKSFSLEYWLKLWLSFVFFEVGKLSTLQPYCYYKKQDKVSCSTSKNSHIQKSKKSSIMLEAKA